MRAMNVVRVEAVEGVQMNKGVLVKQMRFALVVLSVLASGCGPYTYAPWGGLPTVEQNLKMPPYEAPYRVEVGDVVAVTFYRNPELNQEVTVRPDGFISLPFVDDIKAAGKTPKEIDDELTLKYRGELAVPDVTVSVSGFAGHKIYVGGEVASEGVHPLVGGLTLYQSIDQAGGFLETAKRTQVIVIRRGPDGKPTGHSFDIRQ